MDTPKQRKKPYSLQAGKVYSFIRKQYGDYIKKGLTGKLNPTLDISFNLIKKDSMGNLSDVLYKKLKG